MVFFVFAGYTLFYNKAFSGYEARGAHIWLSGATVKFVNNWLAEGPVNLRFLMLEYPRSIELPGLTQRGAYISYPPGAMLPVYLAAKLLGKAEIQIGFIKKFLTLKFLLDTLLVCFVAYSVFRWTLRLKDRKMAAFVSIIFTLCWMCIPINLYYLRNAYFADQCVISVVMAFILLEIYDDYFSEKSTKPLLRFTYTSLKFLVSLFGVLTDYYFLFVLFVSWLVKIIPLFRVKDPVKNIIRSSFVYVLPVLSGIGLFLLQLTTVPDFKNIIINKMMYRMFSNDDWRGGIKIIAIAKGFALTYSWVLVFIAMFASLFIFIFLKQRNNRTFIVNHHSLFGFMIILYVPPVLQVLVLQQHSAIHEFSLLKFAFPVLFSVVLLVFFVFHLKGAFHACFLLRIENGDSLHKIKISVFFSLITVALVLLSALLNADPDYYQSRMGKPVSYERENLIRANYEFNDVYFSFTESIDANPPQYLAISKKLVYKIDRLADINGRFPNLSNAARILLMVHKDDSLKPAHILETERDALKDASLLFSSDHYGVYGIGTADGIRP
jgi:hypothetical protein